MCPESVQHRELRQLFESKLSEWFGATITEYFESGHRLDVYAISPNNISIYVEIIWSKGQYEHDIIALQRVITDIKVVVASQNVLEDKSKIKDYVKFARKQLEDGITVPPEMLSGERILQDKNYVDSELRGIFKILMTQAKKRISIYEILSNIITELQANKEKLIYLFASGKTSYMAHLLQTNIWNIYKDKVGEVSFVNIEKLSKIYHNLEMINTNIKSIPTVVSYNQEPFLTLRKTCRETSEDIDRWIEEIQQYLPKN